MKYIVSNSKILNGTPVVRGTRVPVERIVFLFKEGYTIEDINEEYDHIDIKTIAGVLDELTQMAKIKHGTQTSQI